MENTYTWDKTKCKNKSNKIFKNK